MADLFDTYESDFQLAYQEAKTKLDQVSLSDPGTFVYFQRSKFERMLTIPDYRKSLLREIEGSLDECNDLLEQMSIEVQGMPLNARGPFNQKIRQYRQQASDGKANLRKLLDSQDKNDLFGSRYSDNEPLDANAREQRRQLLQNQLSIDRSLQRLLDSQRIALETENVGSNILNDLRAQREQIVGARDTLQLADGYVDKLIKSLKSMSRRITANKFISYAIIGVLILLILLVLASKFW